MRPATLYDIGVWLMIWALTLPVYQFLFLHGVILAAQEA